MQAMQHACIRRSRGRILIRSATDLLGLSHSQGTLRVLLSRPATTLSHSPSWTSAVTSCARAISPTASASARRRSQDPLRSRNKAVYLRVRACRQLQSPVRPSNLVSLLAHAVSHLPPYAPLLDCPPHTPASPSPHTAPTTSPRASMARGSSSMLAPPTPSAAAPAQVTIGHMYVALCIPPWALVVGCGALLGGRHAGVSARAR
ncbi:hypothetical protein B0H21DRAFT_515458 [Amylocystis lapponica]|nr:hypothetical protein B0H21DRAFT_515458 [Amylocystis lapponica]